nr:hypothetical protein [Tanacetum cinerariifolium]
MPGAKTRVHTLALGESEAQNGLPGSIISSEPKTLVQHRPHPSQSVWSPNGLSNPPEASRPTASVILGTVSAGSTQVSLISYPTSQIPRRLASASKTNGLLQINPGKTSPGRSSDQGCT